MAMSNFEKMKLKRAAAGLYMSEPNGSQATGIGWHELSDAEKEVWMAKALSKSKEGKYEPGH